MPSFTERFIELLEENEVSAKDLARDLKISLQTIYSWKKGKQQIYLSNLISLCNYFQCSIEFIAGRSENVLDYVPKTTPKFYDALREMMRKRKISTYKVYQETRYSGSYFARWKKGAEPYLSTLIELADYFGCTVDQLVGRER